jgi:hypothetical protein
MAATATASATAQASATTAIPLVGALSTSSATDGTLAEPVAAAALEGAAQASATTAGTLTAAIRLDGSATASAATTGAITAAIRLDGSAAASATGQAVLSTAVQLVGALSATATTSGQVTVVRRTYQTDLVAALRSVPGMPPVYVGVAPEGATLPRVVNRIRHRNAGQTFVRGGWSGDRGAVLVVQAADYDTLTAVAGQVRAALEGLRTDRVHDSRVTTEADALQPEAGIMERQLDIEARYG